MSDDELPAPRGYAWPPSVRPGGLLALHVSSPVPYFVVDFHRVGASGRAGRVGPFAGVERATGDVDTDWSWPAHGVRVPTDWRSGAYLAILRPSDPGGRPLDDEPDLATANGMNRVLFVVRPPVSTSPILYKLPLFTYQAYNMTAGRCLYGEEDEHRVTLRRAGGGTGHLGTPGPDGVFASAPDPYGTPRDRDWNTFEKWDAKFLRWLEGRFAVDVCTDWDLHREPALLEDRRLLVSAGHDEYWTGAMREHVDRFVQNGGHVCFFGGNTCYWRVDLEGDTLVCDKRGEAFRWDRQPHRSGGYRFENELTGVGFATGGGHWSSAVAGAFLANPRAPLGYTLQHTDMWPFAGTGLADGDELGAQGRLIGYEADSAPLGRDGELLFTRRTPASFHVLGRAFLDKTWETQAAELGQAVPAATMGLFCPAGTVFNAGTTDWPRLLASDGAIAKITHNVLHRLSHRLAGREIVAQIEGARAIASPMRGHVLVVDANGVVHDLAHGELGRVSGAVALAAFPGAVLLLAEGGRLHEVADQSVLARLPGAVAVAGFAGVETRHAVVGLASGVIRELTWSGAVKIERERARLTSCVALAAFVAPEGTRHVLAADAEGRLHEVIWSQGGESVIHPRAQLGPVAGLAGFVSSDGRHAIVAQHDGNVYELVWQEGGAVVRDVLPHVPGARALAAQIDDDGFRRAWVACHDGTIHELHWKP